jgi:hypothetical protein
MGLRTGYALVIPLGLAAVVAFTYQTRIGSGRGAEASAHGAAGAEQAGDVAILSPSYWVAFDASFRILKEPVNVAGRFFRSADGSTRVETGPEGGPPVVVSISNVASERHYEYDAETDRTRWRSYPMRLHPDGHHPKPRSLTRTKGLAPDTRTIEGFQVYAYTTRGKVVRYEAPALNFFALKTEFEDSRQEFFNLQLRDQPPVLFSPPLGASVEERDQLRGIVYSW